MTDAELKALAENALGARECLVAALSRDGVSADLREKILGCFDYLAGGGCGKTLTVATQLIYWTKKIPEHSSAVAALGNLVADEQDGGGDLRGGPGADGVQVHPLGGGSACGPCSVP